MRSDGNFEWTVALQKGEAYQQCNTFMLHNRRWKHIKKGDTSPNQACKINMSINILFVTIFSQKYVIISKAMLVFFPTWTCHTYFDFTACSHLPPMLWNNALNMISVVHVQKIELQHTS